MNYITTNIRLSEEEYLKLKAEAARKRKSLAAIVRERISSRPDGSRSSEEVKRIMEETKKLASRNTKYLKGVDGVTIIREMRNNAKW